MNPNEALNNIRQAVSDFVEARIALASQPSDRVEHQLVHAMALIENFQVLDEWSTHADFLPDDWTHEE